MKPRPLRRPLALLLALVPLAGALSCELGPPPEVQLADASRQVTFASVELLGPHHYLSSVHRSDARPGRPEMVVDEVVEISWQDWDRFQVRRLVDGEALRETIVVDGVPWVRSADRWDRRDDAEPHRVQLRTTWNTWDEMLGSVLNYIELVPDGDDIVEGRPASRYLVRLLTEEQAPRPKGYGFKPVSVEGKVWLDKATAVRLKAEVVAVTQRDALTRTIRLAEQRANIGEDQGVTAPPG